MYEVEIMTRIPTQKRSIETYNKIVDEGFKLICEKGYYNTNTNEIAHQANVSTGIVYQYFNDKKEIFIEGIKKYNESIMYPMINIIEDSKINDIDTLLNNLINSFIKNHKLSKKAHEELIAMGHLDDDINNIFIEKDIEYTNKIVSILKENNINVKNPRETIHIIMGIIDNLCHEIVYHKHEEIDYDIMKKEVIDIIKSLLK
jgi:AcrR family transcriptional regulator